MVQKKSKEAICRSRFSKESLREIVSWQDKLITGVISFFYLLVWFDLRICLNPLSCFLMISLRCILWYIIYIYSTPIGEFIIPSGKWFREFSFSNVMYLFAITLPLLGFSMWYAITTFFMFIGGITNHFGFRTNFDAGDLVSESDYSEIERFLNWRNNKMRFMSYEDSAKLMSDTGMINNLNTQDPEARRTLDYINNKMRFRSYSDSLKLLRGDKN